MKKFHIFQASKNLANNIINYYSTVTLNVTKMWMHRDPNATAIVHIAVTWHKKQVTLTSLWIRCSILGRCANKSKIGHNDFTGATQSNNHLWITLWRNKDSIFWSPLWLWYLWHISDFDITSTGRTIQERN